MPTNTRWLWPLAVAALAAGDARAEPMTFDGAQSAAASGPALRASAMQLDAAQSSRRAAGALPDPRLTFGIENVPVTGPIAGRLGADAMTMARAGVMQDFPSAARRRADVTLAEAEITTAEANQRIVARDARLGAALAWIDLYYAERRLAALDTILANLRRLWDVAPSAVTSGSSRPAQALAPGTMRASLEDRRSELIAAAARARAELTRWTGDPAPIVTGPPPRLEISVAELRAGLDRQPTLAAYEAAARRADAGLDVARAARRPDWTVELSYGHRDPAFGDMVSLGVSVRLPLFAAQRQEPIIQARALDVNRVVVERAATRRALQAALEGDLADHAMHHDQWRRARDEVLPIVQHQADLETASYGAGRAGLADVLEAFVALANTKLDVLEREAMVVRDTVRINLTYGSDTP